ncbi:NRDE family protein [Verticiella sediminum]|uniref:NRDE family protein n=1 Tax=Verticiella sediminum TaxID=1247510 RepID=A0A556A7M6_9BURK|nr:NRDE family protein [Verticiella sediminum]TSH88877.1 NRDE family protein [Verticiella sediminum]
MCLIAFSWMPGSDMPLLLLANRDEFYARPTAPAEWWAEAPGVWAGRDLQAGGTWMGVTQTGRFAALTNFRDGRALRLAASSRGHLVADFLAGDVPTDVYMRGVSANGGAYNGFNLVAGSIYGTAAEPAQLWYCGNQPGGQARALAPGLYGLSNAVLDTPWPKLTRLKARLAGVSTGNDDLIDASMAFLSDPTPAEDDALPATGVPLERERMLSPIFIVTPEYGTRAQTVLRADGSGRIDATERSYESAAAAKALLPDTLRRMRFRVQRPGEAPR